MSKKDPIGYLKKSIEEGQNWYIALLQTIGFWFVPEEDYNGRQYSYLIGGEAFDWILLAERLCLELSDLVPEHERVAMLFGKPPLDVSLEQFKDFVGKKKYSAFLNYFYGVTVEQALQLAIEMEIDKEDHARLRTRGSRDKAFKRIYGAGEKELFDRFRKDTDSDFSEDISLRELDEFTYWLFKYRFTNSDSACVASDTRKALKLLEDWKILPIPGDKP